MLLSATAVRPARVGGSAQTWDRAVAHPKLLLSNLVDSPEFLSGRSLPELFS